MAQLGYLGFEFEVRFHPTRRWRFDAARTDLRVAVEYAGIVGGGPSHSSFGGIARDAEKFTEAAILGWLVVICNAPSVASGKAMDQVVRAIEARGGTI